MQARSDFRKWIFSLRELLQESGYPAPLLYTIMAGAASTPDGHSPSYLSAHSADVILSDIRPIKLKVEALHSINVLLDEFLYKIINTAQSLVTDKLRAGLLSVLPTPLGKEALLEAEVELRAYKDRTKSAKTVEDDKDTFNLAWAFELLQLKCQAYSTLNESDDDPATTILHAPSPTLVAPAALYLTAILEHILSNVGRVASRDSSRTSATVEDVFVALCEDETIYGLFKTMKVYSQIEEISTISKSRRSKSISRSDKLSISRTSSPYDMSSKDSRISSEASSSVMAHTLTGSRASLDKNKSMKKLISNSSRLSSDTNNTHKRSESILSEETKQTLAAFNQGLSFDDGASLQEFDDLMRSGSTMKVSLTPDRLKSMEVYKQERDRGNRRPTPLFPSELDPSSSPTRANGRRPSLRHVHSITEDEEPLSSPASSRTLQSSSTPNPPAPSNRARSFSVASPSPSTSSSTSSRLRKYSKPSIPFAPSKPSTPPPVPMAQSRRGGLKGSDASPFPAKTRNVQRNRESLDLDDVMAGSDDDNYEEAIKEPSRRSPPSVPTTPKRAPKVSSNTRDLMDFLDAGPPSTGPHSTVPKVSRAAKDMMDFLNEGPPEYMVGSTSTSFIEIEKPKSGRLQRMMSKLSMGGEKTRGAQGNDDFGRSIRRQPSTPVIHSKPSHPSLPALANRPIPPRPPPISPPASPHDHYDDFSVTRPKKPTVTNTPIPKVEPTTVDTPSVPAKTDTQEVAPSQAPAASHSVKKGEDATVASRANHSPVNGTEKAPSSSTHSSEKSSPIKPAENPPSRTSHITRKAPPPIVPDAPPQTVVNDMQDMHRLMSRATTVDECRVILELFLAKSGVAGDKAIEMEVPYPSPSPSDNPESAASDMALEQALVEYFLGSEVTPEGPPLRKKKHSSRRIKVVPTVDVAPPPPSSGAVTSVVEDVTPKHTSTVIEVSS
ncbi:hypothetical protein F5146DRAFT_1044855 [Armillaria mellea]|nr:hypothetical protein F5146DRAFT_1044855 [Armillaria mellea]